MIARNQANAAEAEDNPGPEDALQVLQKKATAAWARQDYDEALVDFEALRKADPSNPLTYTYLGAVKRMTGDLEGALQDLNTATKMGFVDPSTLATRASVKHLLGDLTGAIADATTAIEINSNTSRAYLVRGLCETRLGSAELAIADYTEYISQEPKDVFGYVDRAAALQSKDDFKGAIKDYQAAFKFDQWNAEFSRYRVALILRRLHQPEAPAGLESTVPALHDDWLKSIGLFLMGKIDEGELFSRAAAGTPKKVGERKCVASYYAGMAHLLKGEKEAAKALFQQSIAPGVDTQEDELSRQELKRLSLEGGAPKA